MIKQTYRFWTDAKHRAREASLDFGFAWILSDASAFKVAVGELPEEAPTRKIHAEFKNGEEQ